MCLCFSFVSGKPNKLEFVFIWQPLPFIGRFIAVTFITVQKHEDLCYLVVFVSLLGFFPPFLIDCFFNSTSAPY